MTTTPETVAPTNGPTPLATPVATAQDAADTVAIASYPTYRSAEAAVDRLSDVGFPVAGVTIVGRGVTTVEHVTGRLTKGRAALSGLAGGLWTGLFIGLLMGLFVPGVAWLSLMLTALVFGAAFGALFGFAGHAMTGGRRDFASVPSLRAETYDVVVDRLRADAASAALSGAAPRS